MDLPYPIQLSKGQIQLVFVVIGDWWYVSTQFIFQIHITRLKFLISLLYGLLIYHINCKCFFLYFLPLLLNRCLVWIHNEKSSVYNLHPSYVYINITKYNFNDAFLVCRNIQPSRLAFFAQSCGVYKYENYFIP